MKGSDGAALTGEQRLHLEIHGYVVIEHSLTAAETTALHDRLLEIEEDFHANGPVRQRAHTSLPRWTNGNPDGPVYETPSHFYLGQTREFFRVDNLPDVDPLFFDYVTHPRLVGMAEEAVGGPVRLEQSDAHVLRPQQDSAHSYGFHRGAFSGFGYTIGGLYHFPFVKALTNLTDVGPDDGGTTVIAGSHKLDDALVSSAVRIALADSSERFLHKVVAPAGSTLLFFESLVHSAGINRSGRQRLLVLAGYTPTMFQSWPGYDPTPELLATLDDDRRDFFDGGRRWLWPPRGRSLDDESPSL